MSDILLWLAAAVLLALSGLFSGLNIGLMMARPDDLKRKARQGDKIAARVYRYRKDGYYLIFCIFSQTLYVYFVNYSHSFLLFLCKKDFLRIPGFQGMEHLFRKVQK